MNQFNHYLISRIAGVNSISKSSPSDEWLKHRLIYMKTYYIPSILNQSCKNFKWVGIICKATPKWFIDELSSVKELQLVCDSLSGCVAHDLPKQPKVDWVITSRLDNDDFIHKNYIKNIQDSFDEKEKFIIYPDGLQYKDGLFYHYNYPKNAFISYIEPTSKKINTAYGWQHTKIHELNTEKIFINRGEYMWGMCIHELNLKNSLRSNKIVKLSEEELKDMYNIVYDTNRFSKQA